LPPGPHEGSLRRALGRLRHLNDPMRIDASPSDTARLTHRADSPCSAFRQATTPCARIVSLSIPSCSCE
jgi:hypothetical protein